MKKIGIMILLFMCSLLVLSACEPPRDYETEIQTAINNRDADSLASIILDYNEAGLSEKLKPIVEQYFIDLAGEQNYSNFTFMRKTIEGLGEADEAQTLNAICDEQYINEVKGFLSESWIRKDASNLDGAVITINLSEDGNIAVLKDIDNILNKYSTFAVGDIKWDDIIIIDRNTIKFDDLSKREGMSYCPSLGKIDYDNYTITTHASDDVLLSVLGGDQIWIREDYYNSFEANPILSEEDFIITLNGEKENPVRDSGFWSSALYDITALADSSGETQYVCSTYRGVNNESTLEDVVLAYGIGGKCILNTDKDSMCIMLDTYLNNYQYSESLAIQRELLYNDSLQYYLQYTDAAKEKRIRFYFDDNDEVVVILFLANEPAYYLSYCTDGTDSWWEIDFSE